MNVNIQIFIFPERLFWGISIFLTDMYILFSEKCLEYRASGHPETPERILNAYEFLRYKEFEFLEPNSCKEEDLLLVHSREFVEKIRKEVFLDSDTPNLAGIYDYAILSVGSSLASMEIALQGEKTLSLMRPPGHHVGRDGKALGSISQGFCYFNNIAVACAKALQVINKVAIIDIDCHHGNGTQEIFQDNKSVLFVSLHRNGQVYPGTGTRSQKNCLNFPFYSRVGDVEYLKSFEKAIGEVRKFKPDLIGVSAGFDTHRFDPMFMFNLSEDVYKIIGNMIAGLETNLFCVLEGGYGKFTPQCIHNFLIGLDQI